MFGNNLIEIDLIDGGALDCIPHQIQYVEAFDGTKNEAFPDAQAFVLFQSEGLGHLLTATTYEDIKAGIEKSGDPDYFEVETAEGNRAIMRKSLVTSRSSGPDGKGSLVTLSMGGQYRTTPLTMDMASLRETMKTQIATPPGLQLVAPENIEPVLPGLPGGAPIEVQHDSVGKPGPG